MSRLETFLAATMLAVFPIASAVPLPAQSPPLVSGQVKKVDESASKITIKSGPIKNLDMADDDMTMVFAVQDPQMLKGVRSGDKIKFTAERVNGTITVTKLQK